MNLIRLILFIFLLFKSMLIFANFYQVPYDGSNIIGQPTLATVKSGDNLHKIAQRYDIGYGEIIKANPTINPDKLSIGQSINIPSQFTLPSHQTNEIVINVSKRRLFYFMPNNQVFTAPIAVGRTGWETPKAIAYVERKVTDPYWKIPKELIADKAKQGVIVPEIIPPGPNNPLGQYAMTLSLPSYLIHGTNDPTTIGKRISAGCIRLYPKDIAILFDLVPVGTKVRIVN